MNLALFISAVAFVLGGISTVYAEATGRGGFSGEARTLGLASVVLGVALGAGSVL